MASKSRPKQRNSSGKPRSAQSRSDSGLPESDDSSDEEQQLKLKTKAKQKKSAADRRPSKPEVDLTNPEDLLKKLDQLQLTEADTEELLKHAYSINRMLKKEISRGDEEHLRRRGERLPPISSSGGRRRPVSDTQRHKTRVVSAQRPKHRAKPEWVD